MLDAEGQKFKDVSKCHTVNIVIYKKLREWLITDKFNRVHTTEREIPGVFQLKNEETWERAVHDFWLNPSKQICILFLKLKDTGTLDQESLTALFHEHPQNKIAHFTTNRMLLTDHPALL